MRQFQRLYGHFIAIRLQVAGLHLHREGIVHPPCDDRLMVFVEQADGDVAPFHLIQVDGLDPGVVFRIVFEGAALQRDVAEFVQSGHFDFRIIRTVAISIFDGLHLDVHAGDF